MADLFAQGDFGVRLDWGPTGAAVTAADIAVIVDVLSFSTSVTVAVERGMRVFPYRWTGARAEEFAAALRAVLAVGRLETTKDGGVPAPSLSPAMLLTGDPVPRLVLPSPNGSTIAATLQDGATSVAIGCLRNAEAVAHWISPALGSSRSVAVVAAGERWSYDNSLRPALEDQLGAGAILRALLTLGHGDQFSPEAFAAAEFYASSASRLGELMHSCVSGLELIRSGFSGDIDVAADLNVSSVVPILVDQAFVSAE